MANRRRHFASSLWRRGGGGDRRNTPSIHTRTGSSTEDRAPTRERHGNETPCPGAAVDPSSTDSSKTTAATTTTTTTTATTTTTTTSSSTTTTSSAQPTTTSSERLDLRGSDLTNPLTLQLLYTVIDTTLVVPVPITSIDLSWTHLGDDNAQSLLSEEHHLLDSKSVKELVLCGNGLGQKGNGDYLTRFLQRNTSVTKLHLGSNTLSHDFAMALARGLCDNATLEELDLWNCHVGDQAGAHILTSAQSARKLRTLRCNLNQLGPRSLRAATRLLETPTTALQVLNLDTNPRLFGQEDNQDDAIAFVEALTANETLRWLGVPYTGIEDFVAGRLFQALTTNTSLEYIDVGYNEINKEGYAVMVECIPHMKALKFLRTHARAQLVSADVLTKAMEQNTALHQFTSICVGCNKLWAILRRNQVLSMADEFVCSDTIPLNVLPHAVEKLSAQKDGGASATFQLLQCYFR